MGVWIWLVGVAAILAAYLYMKMSSIFSHWKRRGVKGPKPVPLFGSFLETFTFRKCFGQVLTEIYMKYPEERFVGYFTFMQPQLMLRDPRDVELITIKEFSSFMNMGISVNEEKHPYNSFLFALGASRWKAMRMKMTPAFTTGKLRAMVPQMASCWDNVVNFIEKSGKEKFEIKDLLEMFTSDVVASVAFGLDPVKLGGPHSEFRTITRKFFDISLLRFIGFVGSINFPWFTDLIGIRFFPKDIEKYFVNVMKQTMTTRRETGYQRNDFAQLLMQLLDKGSVDVSYWAPEDEYLLMNDKAQTEKIEITESLVVSQALLFFTAGFETTSSTMMFAVFELSKHPQVLSKLTDEVDRVMEKHKGEFSYQAVQEMVYLEQCVKETLRLYPPTSGMQRMCTKRFTMDSGLTLEVGDVIIVPIEGLHKDPKYWKDPLEFRPERFSKENEPNIVPFSFLPFGSGPRICIAMRFALLEVRVLLAKLVHDYDFQACPECRPPVRSLTSFINSPVGTFPFTIKRRRPRHQPS